MWNAKAICWAIRGQPQCYPSGENAVPRAYGGSLTGAIHNQELVFQEKGLRNDGTDIARSEQVNLGR